MNYSEAQFGTSGQLCCNWAIIVDVKGLANATVVIVSFIALVVG